MALQIPIARKVAADRPSRIVMTMAEIGGFVHDLRKGLDIRQDDLARRAGVGRQWIGDLEQGKPTLEAAMVLRTLEVLGFEVELKPYDPIPPWITRAIAAAKARQAQLDLRRRLRRRANRREIARHARLIKNAPKVVVDVE